jgi:hypothetical protein
MILYIQILAVLCKGIGFAESFRVTSPTARNDASARLCFQCE